MIRSRTGRQAGFTLIEALVTIMIIGILLGLAAPSFQSYTASQRVKTVSFDLYAALVFARSEALKRKQTITVEPASSGDWTTGWVVKTSSSNLRVQDRTTGVAISGSASVVFRQDGRLTSGSAVGVLIQPGTADSSIKNRCIRIDLTGLPKSSAITGAVCP